MYHFILQLLIMLSLGTLVYLAARKIPQISDTVPEDSAAHSTGIWHQIELILGRLPLDKFDLMVSQFLEKNIRKMKLALARFDNYLNQHLEQFKTVKHHTQKKQQKKFVLFESTADADDEQGVQSSEDEGLQGRTTESARNIAKEESKLSKPSK